MKFNTFLILVLSVILLSSSCTHVQKQSNYEMQLTENKILIEHLENKNSNLRNLIQEYVQKRYEVEKLAVLVEEKIASEDELLSAHMELILLEKELDTLPEMGLVQAENILQTMEENLNDLRKRNLISEQEANNSIIRQIQIKIQLGIDPEYNQAEMQSAIDTELKRLHKLMDEGLISKDEYELNLMKLNQILEFCRINL